MVGPVTPQADVAVGGDGEMAANAQGGSSAGGPPRSSG